MEAIKSSLPKIVFYPLLLLVLCSCAQKTSELHSPAATSTPFSDSGEEPLESHWWTAFGDSELNSIVDRALRNNFNLETTWQRLRAAEAVVDRESASLFPDLEGQLQGEEQRPESAGNEQLRLGFTSEYEVDLWGRIRSQVEAERYRAKASHADYKTAALTLSAEVARTWFQLITARNQRDLLEDQVNANEKVLSLIKSRFGSGQGRSVDVLRQQQLLESTRQQYHSTSSRVQVLEHQLAVLLGRSPNAKINYETTELPQIPDLPETGLPTDLVQRRPDVQQAFFELQAADLDLAAAIRNQFPRLSLTASLSSTGNNAEDLFDDWIRSFAGNLFGPVFDAGQRSAEVDRREALKQQRIYAYGQSVLTAFREVEDALIQERKQEEQIKNLRTQVRLARETYEQLRVEYFNGVGNYLDVLTALTDEQQLRRDLLSAELGLMEFRIALYRALAGGFETDREASA